MDFKKNQFIIKESKDKSVARFFIAYRNNKESKQISYRILSLLKRQNDVVLEIDSTLTTLSSPGETETAALSLLKDLKDLDIDLRHQQSEAKSNKGLLGILNLNKTYTAHKILAYIPDKLWRDELFQLIIPGYGVRYYICKGQVDGGKLLEDLHCGRILEAEKIELFDFVIYDSITFAQMGVNTKLSKEELQKLLTVE